MKIDALRKSGELQKHHWNAIVWFEDQVRIKQRRLEIARCCRQLEVESGCYGIDPYALLCTAIVSRKSVSLDPKVIGVLREALNSIHRLRVRH